MPGARLLTDGPLFRLESKYRWRGLHWPCHPDKSGSQKENRKPLRPFASARLRYLLDSLWILCGLFSTFFSTCTNKNNSIADIPNCRESLAVRCVLGSALRACYWARHRRRWRCCDSKGWSCRNLELCRNNPAWSKQNVWEIPLRFIFVQCFFLWGAKDLQGF